MPKPYDPHKHFTSIMNREQTNSIDILLKAILESGVKQGMSQEMTYKLLEAARRLKDQRLRRKRLKVTSKKEGLSFWEVKKRTNVYSFKETKEWTYRDYYNPDYVKNSILSASVKGPHLVLYDKTGNPRFVLGYDLNYWRNTIIYAIQKVRTKNAYSADTSGYFTERKEYRHKLEEEETEKFKQELGMYPSEFLLSEFILRNRAQLSTGNKIFFRVAKHDPIYAPLISRFCKNEDIQEIDVTKKRVREILGL